MLLGCARPAALAGAILNDIGPVIEPLGLMRIKSYVGKLPQPATLAEGAEVLRRLFGSQFPRLEPDDWEAFAGRTFKEEGGKLVADYDPQLASILEGIDIESPLSPLWNEFDSLARVPVMVIRGANSDLLSATTTAAMAARHPNLELVEVPDQGHAPLLSEAGIIRRIATFIAACDQAARR
jgi:pimeloyl-ACP methyl ester carboxylesterase